MTKTINHSLTKLADAAFEQAARKVIERARQTGTPVIVWEDGAVTEVQPDDMGETGHLLAPHDSNPRPPS
ncbi:MAG: hypothetical protein ACK5EA_14690 [Planctomycetaceae bacterium]|jgi:hypothetical protein